ncbi:MAG: aminotransferase class V-fold PLP-dependent enzyme, partial [bacterium]
KGVGALYVRSKNPRVKISKQMHGGSQEKGLRSGTLNVPGIAGLGKACELSLMEMEAEMEKHIIYRDRIIDSLLKLENVYLNGHRTKRLTNNINVSLGYIDIDALIGEMRDIAISTGSACTSASMAPSHVLTAIGRSNELAKCSLRISFGRFTTEEEIDYLISRLVSNIEKLRKESPVYNMSKEGIL